VHFGGLNERQGFDMLVMQVDRFLERYLLSIYVEIYQICNLLGGN
jgi:hypothetical protein